MSENEKSSHWNSLASELGAESAPRPAKPQVLPPAAPPRAKKKPAATAPSPPKGNWQDLAASLGVDVPPPPPKPAAPKPAAPPKPDTLSPAVSAPPARATEPSRESREQRPPRSRHDQPDRERSGRRRGQPDRPARPASPRLGPASGEAVEYVHAEHVDAEFVGAEFVDDIDLLEDLDEPLTATGEGRETPRGEAGQRGETRQRDDEQRGGRRRRRRRRGGRRLREDAQAARSDEPRDETSDFLEVEFAEGDGPTADFLDDVAPAFDEEEAETDEPREVESGEAEPREKRRRGRRRGRGRGRTHDAGREAPAATERTAADDDDLLDELASAGSPRDQRQPRVRDDLGDVDTDSEIDADADDDAQDDAELRPSHRAIPSWQEAVGMIVAANMESRAKNPHSASQRPRGRGGRGRGRGRERR